MEVESFENEGVAKLLNDWFVSIKVDRKERPDVDKVYMTYVQALYGGGGWPLSVFLSPDLKPLMGGTYFPPDDKYGRPGFKTILRKVKEAWENKKDVLVKSGAFAIEQLSEALSCSSTSDKLPDGVPASALRLCSEQVIVSWNGLAISSFARASKILKGEAEGTKFNFPVVGTEPKEYMRIAEKAASFIKKQLYNAETHRLQHSFRNSPSKAPGFLDDYAFLISGLLDLYEFGGGINWLLWAIELQETQGALFLDKDGGGYFNNTGEDSSVLLRVKEDHDGAEPSGNSVSAINLTRLASIVSGSKAEQYKRIAEHLLAVFEKRLKETAMAVPLMCCAADMLRVPSRKQVVVVGERTSEEFESMLAAAHALYDPNKTVIHIDPSNKEEMEFWEVNNSNITLMAKSNYSVNKVVALVCQNFTCSPPVTDHSSLEALLSQKSSSSST